VLQNASKRTISKENMPKFFGEGAQHSPSADPTPTREGNTFSPDPIIDVLYMSLQYFDTVGWVFWSVKTVSHITYTVLAGT